VTSPTCYCPLKPPAGSVPTRVNRASDVREEAGLAWPLEDGTLGIRRRAGSFQVPSA